MNSTVEPLHNGHLGGQKKAVVDLGRGQPPLFLDQNEARRAENNFLETPPPYLRVWMTGPHWKVAFMGR